MMGHLRIETTQIYAKVTDKKVEEDMKKLKGSVPDDDKKWRSGSPAFFSIFLSYTYTHLCSSRHLL